MNMRKVSLVVASVVVAAAIGCEDGPKQPYQQSPPGAGNNWNNGQGRDHRGRRHAWRDNRRDARWDDAQHNGYYSYNTWHYGPPRQMSRNVTLGYRPWTRGQRLGYYGDRYSEVDYRRENLRAPRRGYHWVRDNDGDFLLAAIATGVILQVVLSNNRYN